MRANIRKPQPSRQPLKEEALSPLIEPMSVVNDAIEDGVGIGGIANEIGHFSTGGWLAMMVDRRP